MKMKVFEKLRESNEFNPLYLDHLVQKAKVSKRRKSKFGQEGDIYRTHWANHAGTYKDEEMQKFPKFYRSKKPVKIDLPIKTRQDLITAIDKISAGEADCDDYKGVVGLSRGRLLMANSLRDQGIERNSKKIARIGYVKIQPKTRFYQL